MIQRQNKAVSNWHQLNSLLSHTETLFTVIFYLFIFNFYFKICIAFNLNLNAKWLLRRLEYFRFHPSNSKVGNLNPYLHSPAYVGTALSWVQPSGADVGDQKTFASKSLHSRTNQPTKTLSELVWLAALAKWMVTANVSFHRNNNNSNEVNTFTICCRTLKNAKTLMNTTEYIHIHILTYI